MISEVRVWVAGQISTGSVNNSGSLSAEALLAPLATVWDAVPNALIPSPYLCGGFNLSGGTSSAYAGLAWTYNVTPATFVEGSFRGAVHNGETDSIASRYRALGCTTLFSESASAGPQLSE